jgi:putative transposase
MQLRYNYRLYPTAGQRSALARAFGCARVVFNDALAARQQAHAAGQPFLTDADLSARLTAAKATRSGPGSARSPRRSCSSPWRT